MGDSAYPLSDVLMTPYSEDESRRDDLKCLFNVRHSQARVEMTENIYGILKRRFPIVKYIRTNLSNAKKITAAAAVLHNIALDWHDQPPQDAHPNAHQEVEFPIVENLLNPAEARASARQARENYRLMTDQQATGREQQRILLHRAAVQARQQNRR